MLFLPVETPRLQWKSRETVTVSFCQIYEFNLAKYAIKIGNVFLEDCSQMKQHKLS